MGLVLIILSCRISGVCKRCLRVQVSWNSAPLIRGNFVLRHVGSILDSVLNARSIIQSRFPSIKSCGV